MPQSHIPNKEATFRNGRTDWKTFRTPFVKILTRNPGASEVGVLNPIVSPTMRAKPEFRGAVVDGCVYEGYIYCHGERKVQMFMKHIAVDRLPNLSIQSLELGIVQSLYRIGSQVPQLWLRT
jgi:hypothetical protein